MSRHQGYIQPILVARGAPHEDTVVAAALASVDAWLLNREADSWKPWLGSAFAKTVRRARPVEIERAAPDLAARVEIGTATALAGAPFPTEALPRVVAKCQVSGTDFPRTGTWPTSHDTGPVLAINADAGMSTGKCAAQAAHGLFGWALTRTDMDLHDWREAGRPVTVLEAGTHAWRSLAARPPHGAVVIRDAGYTEITPGTTTVIAYQQGEAASFSRYMGWKRFIPSVRRG